MPAASSATPMTYLAADGRQIVVIAAGSHWASPTGASDHLLAYALPTATTDTPKE
jgi:quinoprotein glucose dehydrogenase